jgi:hypothetical protein
MCGDGLRGISRDDATCGERDDESLLQGMRLVQLLMERPKIAKMKMRVRALRINETL